MNKNSLMIAVSAMVLSAGGTASSPPASRGTSLPAENQEPVSQSITATPAENPAETQLEYSNQDFGFSLQYPKGYEVQRAFVQTINFLAPQGTPGDRGDRGRGWRWNGASTKMLNGMRTRRSKRMPLWAPKFTPRRESSTASRHISSGACPGRT